MWIDQYNERNRMTSFMEFMLIIKCSCISMAGVLCRTHRFFLVRELMFWVVVKYTILFLKTKILQAHLLMNTKQKTRWEYIIIYWIIALCPVILCSNHGPDGVFHNGSFSFTSTQIPVYPCNSNNDNNKNFFYKLINIKDAYM